MAKEERPFRIGFLIHDVSRLRRTVVDKALKPLGVTRSQWWVLANLSRHNGKGMMQTELAKLMDVGKVTLGGLIDRLEASGYVARQADPADRRAKRVVMTPKGTKLLAEIQRVAEQVNERIMGSIGARDVLRAEEVLYKMKQQLIAMDAVPGTSAATNQSKKSEARGQAASSN
ncbi:MAG TPA: MarR family transcriptional regulator [Steroidobacteraceae bacterium]|nr:MarR family transcriptional regulator [Steroidobacteraceae bacterium]